MNAQATDPQDIILGILLNPAQPWLQTVKDGFHFPLADPCGNRSCPYPSQNSIRLSMEEAVSSSTIATWMAYLWKHA